MLILSYSTKCWGISLGVLDAEDKTTELLLKARTALERWYSNVFPESEAPKSFGELLNVFSAPVDPLRGYQATKLKEGAESALLMVLAYGVEESVLEKIAESFPTNDAGEEVDVTPFVKPSRTFAWKINEYLTARKDKLALEAAKAAEPVEATETSTTAETAPATES